MRWRAGIAAGLVGVLGMLAVPQAFGALNFSSTFAASREGWRASQGFAAASPAAVAAGYDGAAQAITFTDTDAAGEGLFLSPVSWVGNGSDNYGGTFQFDMKSSVTWGGSVTAFLQTGLEGGPEDTLCFVGSAPVNTNFQTFQFTLDTTDALDGLCDGPASISRIERVIGGLQFVMIMADDVATSGDITHLDNISLSGGGPPPPYDVERELSIDHRKVDSPFLNPFWAFTGDLTGDDDDCLAGRTVVFFRKRKGPDEKLGKRTTLSDGSYRFAYDKRPGTYYATTPELNLGLPTCLAVTSEKTQIG